MRTKALLLAPAVLFGALALTPAFAAEPYRAAPSAAASGDAYAYQRSETTDRVGASVQGQVNCQGYCLPPGYVIEDPYAPRIEQPPVHYEETVEEPVYQGEDDRYGARRTYEESSGYSWGYEDRGGWERPDEGETDWGREPCRQRFDAQGRMIESCGEIRLSDSFFWGGGGVGPEYIDGGGGGGGVYAEAGAGASAYASARASVGVSIRIGGGGGHKGGPKGGHGGKGGCGCKH